MTANPPALAGQPSVTVDVPDGWPVVIRSCTGTCGLPNQPHEDHGDGTYLCHNCGHPRRRQRIRRPPCGLISAPHALTYARPYPGGWYCAAHTPAARTGDAEPWPGPGWVAFRDPDNPWQPPPREDSRAHS